MRLLLPLLLAAGFAAATLPDAGAENLGVFVNNGDKMTGSVDSAGDVEHYVLDLSELGSLTVSVKAAKGTTLLPAIRLFDPDGDERNLAGLLKGEGKAKVTLKNFPVDETGLWQVRIADRSAGTGGYLAAFKSKVPKKEKVTGIIIPAGGSHVCEFTGDDDALLIFVVKIKGGSGIDSVEVLDPAGEPVAFDGTLVSISTKAVKGKRIPVTGGFGRYGVRLNAAAGEDTVVDCLVKAKLVKVAKRKLVLGPEPAPTGTDPAGSAAGETVRVQGSDFENGARVWIGDTEVDAPSFVSASAIDVEIPGGVATDSNIPVDVLVQNPDGQFGEAVDGFTYLAVPTIGSVSPPLSPLDGDVELTISGTDFRTGATVTVGGASATMVEIVDSTTITCRTPSGSVGAVDVIVYDEFGRPSNAQAGHSFVGAPTATSVTPDLSPLDGGETMTITGTGFRTGASVTVGGEDATDVQVDSSTSITCTTPAHAAGAVDVVVIDEFGQASGAVGGHTYVGAPTLSSVTPALSPLAGGETITITGSGFRTGASVSVGGSAAANVSVDNSTTITCDTPSGTAGAAGIVVTDEFGQASSSLAGHSFIDAPMPTGVSPDFLPLAGGETVTITGDDIRSTTKVFLDGSEIGSPSIAPGTSLSFTAPAKSAGSYDLELRDEWNQSATASNLVVYDGAPSITSASPDELGTAGGTTVTLTGSGFRTGTRVFVDGGEVTPTIGSTTSLTFSSPAHAAGKVDVAVQDTYGQSSTSVDLLEYVSLSITSVTPSSGTGAGGTRVLVTGIGFGTDAVVKFGSVYAYGAVRVSETSILCTVPPAASLSSTAGTAVDVTVENSMANTATLTDGFTYTADGGQPTVDSTVPADGSTGIARNIGKFVFVLSERAATHSSTTNFDWFGNPNDITSSRVTAVGHGPSNRFVVLTRNTSPTSLASGRQYFVNLPDDVDDVAGNALDPTPFGGSTYQADFTTGSGTDGSGPTVSSSDPASSATGVPVDKTVSITMNEAVDPTTIATAFSLEDGSSATVDGFLDLSDDCRTITFTPRRTLGANETHTVKLSTALKDLAGNALGSAVARTFTTAASDGTAPTAELTVDLLPQDMNGSTTYKTGASSSSAFDAYLPLDGFTIDVVFDDEGGSGIDTSSFSCKCSVAMGSTSANAELASNFTVTPLGANWTVPSTHTLASGTNVVFTVNVDDNDGNSATQVTLTVDAADISAVPGGLSGDRDPFGTKNTWLLRFDQDIWTMSSSAGSSGLGSHTKDISITSSLSSNSTPDFQEDLTLIGLNGAETGTNASTVTNGSDTGTNAIVQTMVKDAVRKYMRLRYGIDADGTHGTDAVNIEFILDGEKGSLSSVPNPSSWTSGSGYSIMTFTGDERPNSTASTLGRSGFDLRNTGENNSSNTGVSNGTNVGTFGANMIRLNINSADSSSFPSTFDPLISTASRGGTPVGTSNDDATVLDDTFVYSSASQAEKDRYDLIMEAVDAYALYLSAVGAHEVGHSVGLVADGAPPTGLFGNAHDSNTFVVTGGFTTSAHVDTEGNNIMASAIGYTSAIQTGDDFASFGPMILAYLLQRFIYDQ